MIANLEYKYKPVIETVRSARKIEIKQCLCSVADAYKNCRKLSAPAMCERKHTNISYYLFEKYIIHEYNLK
jgi:hypothetical protein